jgi:outer membrane protein assembly factor BamA
VLTFLKTQRENIEFTRRMASWTVALLLVGEPCASQGDPEVPLDRGVPGGPVAAMLVAPPPVDGVVGDISIINNNVFDLSDPAEDKVLFRFANRVHIVTKPEVIERQLLLQPGDAYSAQAVEESERNLRQNRYIHEASIVPTQRNDGAVDLEVTTTDVWTLVPKLSFTISGGAKDVSFGIKEQNLLGSGIGIEAQYKSNPDRDAKIFKFRDQNLGGSRYALSAIYSSNSDGRDYAVDFGKPFYSLDARNSNGLSVLDYDRVDSFYDRGELYSEYRHQASTRSIGYGWSKGLQNDWARRYFVEFVSDEHRFSEAPDSLYPPGLVPSDRKLHYPTIGYEIVEDRYEKASNFDQIHRVEDRYFGTRVRAQLGYASEGLGSDRDAIMMNLFAQTGFGGSKKDSLLLAADLEGRLEQGELQNFKMTMEGKYFRRISERSLLHVGLSGIIGHNLDLDSYVQLGGDTGLRGYPLRYQTGESAVLLVVEQRLFTNWYPFRLFRVGGAVFFDAGRTWGSETPSVSDNELLRDVGFGLRLGAERSGLGRMIHIDLAFPLDGRDDIDSMQFYISTKKSF